MHEHRAAIERPPNEHRKPNKPNGQQPTEATESKPGKTRTVRMLCNSGPQKGGSFEKAGKASLPRAK
eukprot:1948232-Lingulodinium_polyedra.AAC.1